MTSDVTAAARQVPFLDLVTVHQELSAEILHAIERSLQAAAFVGGPELENFEAEFASYIGTRYAIAVSTGTDALRLGYLAMELHPEDEVITVPNTFIATTEALTQSGAKIRFVDVDPRTGNMDAAQLAAVIGPRTVGVVPVHLYGQPADVDAIMLVAQRHGLWVVEDAAQAHGSRYRGRRVGADGIAAAFSFYPGKNLGACGEAGALTTNDERVARYVTTMREHGQSAKYYHDYEGYNARLDAWQAAVLRIKLRHLDQWNASRRLAAAWYRTALQDVTEIVLPHEPDWAKGNYHLFVVHADRRDALRAHLALAGVGTGLHYPLPLHLQKAYAHLGIARGTFPVSERLSERLLSLPMYPGLSQDDVGYAAEQVRQFYRA